MRATEAAALLVAGADTILLLCLSYMLVARAIMVPSTARRTFLFGLVLAVPSLVTVAPGGESPQAYRCVAPRPTATATTTAPDSRRAS